MTRTELAETIILKAGEMLLSGFGKIENISAKKAHDYVTEVDTGIETYLRSEIKKHFPDDGLHGEEYGIEEGTSGFVWIIDPLDGTNNFARGIAINGNIIAIEKDKSVVSGFVHLPHLQELYYAHKGEGAFCKNMKTGEVEKLSVSKRGLKDYMFVCDPLQDHEQYAKEAPLWIALHEKISNTRSLYCGAYYYTLIASGKAEMTFNDSYNVWDVAAGALLVQEAGGRVTDIQGNTIQTFKTGSSIVATNGIAHDEVLKIIQNHFNNA